MSEKQKLKHVRTVPLDLQTNSPVTVNNDVVENLVVANFVTAPSVDGYRITTAALQTNPQDLPANVNKHAEPEGVHEGWALFGDSNGGPKVFVDGQTNGKYVEVQELSPKSVLPEVNRRKYAYSMCLGSNGQPEGIIAKSRVPFKMEIVRAPLINIGLGVVHGAIYNRDNSASLFAVKYVKE